MKRLILQAGVLVTPLFVACEAPPQEDALLSVADSSGIRIVTLSRSTAAPVDTVGGPPSVEISAEIGSLGQVAASDANQVFVPDVLRPRTLRVFSSAGEVLGTVGRAGEGPGEFTALTVVTPNPDGGVLVLDGTARRWLRYGADQEFVEGGRIPGSDFPEAADEVSGLSLLRGFDRVPQAAGRVEYPTRRYVWDPSTDQVTEVGRAVGTEANFAQRRGMFISVPMPWAATSEADIGGGRVVVTDPSSNEVLVYGVSGELGQIFRVTPSGTAPSDAEFSQWLEWYLAQADDGFRSELRARVAQLPRPDHRPVLGRVILDDVDRIWVERYQPAHIEQSTWDVFSLVADEVWTVEFGAGFTPHDVRGGTVWGGLSNELDVERVVGWDVPF